MSTGTFASLSWLLLAASAAAQSRSIAVEDVASARRSALRRADNALLAKPCRFNTVQVDIPAFDDGSGFFTGTGFFERIVIMEPCGYDPSGPPRPLVLVNNGWGLSAGSFFNGMSGLPDEASARGWLMVSFTQLDDKSFGVVPLPQQNVERALEYVLAHYPVDLDRIYAVGWSAGGGSVASYAARHLDPARPMIAAIVTNAGSYDLIDTYHSESASVQAIMENPALLTGPPAGAALWNYHRSQTEELNPTLDGVVDARTKLRNLLHIPTYHVWSTDDPIEYLRAQNLQFDLYLSSLGAPLVSQSFTGLADPHSWDLIDASTALDFLGRHTVQRDPASFDVLLDQSATCYWADVTVADSATFTPVAVAASPGKQRLDVHVANVTALTLRPPARLLATDASFKVMLVNDDDATLDLSIAGIAQAPTYLLLGDAFFSAWTYDPATSTLRVSAPVGGGSFSVRFERTTAELGGPATLAPPGILTLTLRAEPAATAVLMLAPSPSPFPLSLIDPADDRYFLIGPSPATVWVSLRLDGTGEAALPICVLSPTLVGSAMYAQFATLPGRMTLVDEVSNLLAVSFVSGG